MLLPQQLKDIKEATKEEVGRITFIRPANGVGFVDKRHKPFQSLYARNFVLFFSTEHICLNNSYFKYYFYYSTTAC